MNMYVFKYIRQHYRQEFRQSTLLQCETLELVQVNQVIWQRVSNIVCDFSFQYIHIIFEVALLAIQSLSQLVLYEAV